MPGLSQGYWRVGFPKAIHLHPVWVAELLQEPLAAHACCKDKQQQA